MTGRPLGSDRGETLLELVVALSIMSVAVVAVVGGLATGVLMSDVHRKQTTAGMAVRNYAEAIIQAVDAGGYPATACAALATSFTAPAGYTATVLSTRYWDGSAWNSTCATDTGLRQLTLQVRSADARAVEQLVIEVRKPCSLSDAICN
jgi:type II secretory pathway pseudopilin PulG